MIKITHVISDTNIGGAGILLCSIVNGLSGEFIFEVILPKGSELSKRLPKNVKITELDIAKDTSFDSKDFFKFFKYFKRNKTDIVHTHASLSARLAAKCSGVRTAISTRHCAKLHQTINPMNIFEKIIYSFSTDITVSTADYATKNLIKYGVNKDTIVTIKNGSPDLKESIKETRFSAHEALGIDKDVKIIGSVARLEKIKGQDLILRSAASILKEYENLHFLFLGTGSQKEEYERLASALGIKKHVSFLGYVKNPQLYQKDFYLNINASRGTETSCLATSECMSLGIPTIASDFGGNTEMIKNGFNGMIFSADNIFSLCEATLKILKDENLYKTLSEGALKSYNESFSLPVMLDAYRKLYNSSKTERDIRRNGAAAEGGKTIVFQKD